MLKPLACVVIAVAATAATGLASAAPSPGEGGPQGASSKAPDAASVRQAAEAFDAGVAALKGRQYELAASRFEAADAAVPSPQALRQAIRARGEAGQGSRAATLAAQGLARYPDDATTIGLANEVIARFAPGLHKAAVRCASPCILAAGTRAIPGEAKSSWVIYLDPEPTSLSASFVGGGSAQAAVDALPGGSSELRFEPPPEPPPGEAPPVERATRPPVAAPAQIRTAVAEAPRSEGGGLPRLVFFGGLALTAGLGGLTIWSGVDTINNPGVDAVRAACAGRDTSCPEYQDGLARQTRTNVLIGVTAGAGALTALGALFTNWRGPRAETGARIAPIAIFTNRHVAFGAEGHF